MCDRGFRRRPVALGPVALLAFFLALGLATTVSASSSTARELGNEARQRFEVLPLRGGVLLKPRAATSYSVIEITEDGVAVDGEDLSGRELRRRLGSDAGVVEAIADLDSDERREVASQTDAQASQPASALPPAAPAGGPSAPPRPPEAPEAPQAPEPPEPPRAPRRHGDAKVSVASSAHVARGESSDDVVVIGGSIDVEGEVNGDAVAIGGSVHVDGKVTGDVVAVGGGVVLGPNAVVFGQVSSVGGHIDRDPAARVSGSTSEVAMGPLSGLGMLGRLGRHSKHVDVDFEPFEHITNLLSSGLRVALLGLFGCLLLLLVRQPLERVADKVGEEPWRSGLTGLAAQVLVVPLFFVTLVVLLVSVIGIPLIVLLPFAMLALIVGAFLGYTAVTLRLGRWLENRFSWNLASPYFVIFVGVLTVQAATVCGRALDWDITPLGFFAALLLFAGFVIQYVAWTVGLGAVLITRFGTYAVWRGWRWHRPETMPGRYSDEPPFRPAPATPGPAEPPVATAVTEISAPVEPETPAEPQESPEPPGPDSPNKD